MSTAEIRYEFTKKLKSIEKDSNSWAKYAKADSVVLDLLKPNYFRIQSEWEEICDYADENRIPTVHFWDKLMSITDNLRSMNDVVAKQEDEIRSGHTNMTKIEVKLGDNATIYGDFVVANSIKESFNRAHSADISDDLKIILEALTIAVGKMGENLSNDSAVQVARDLENLTAEVTSPTPRRQWWELSIDGLKKAANNVGEIGKPVLELVSKIVPILLTTSA